MPPSYSHLQRTCHQDSPSQHRRSRTTTACILAVIATIPVLPSCSSAPGNSTSSFGYASTLPTNSGFRSKVLGLEVAPDTGSVTAGWSERTLLNPSDNNPDTPQQKTGFRPPLAWSWSTSKGTIHTLGWARHATPAPDPDQHFLHFFRFGISLDTGTDRRGLSAGLSNITILSVNPDVNSVRRLRYHSKTPLTNTLTTQPPTSKRSQE